MVFYGFVVDEKEILLDLGVVRNSDKSDIYRIITKYQQPILTGWAIRQCRHFWCGV